jgi:NAD(P)-dependent dehydrogenase (short-subunit alcohol dehydrogenase family)
MLLESKTVIVTGAGRGIGRAIARRFAAEGAAIVLTARSEPELSEAAAEIAKSGGRTTSVTADVSREADCEKIVREARRAFRSIDVLVNNAGILGPVRPVEKVDPREWDRVLAVNLRGPFLLSRLVLPEMYEAGSGSILNIVSVAAKSAFPLNSAYAASKAGLMGLTRTLAAEAAPKGVRVNALSPGPVQETKMSQELGKHLAEYFQVDRETLNREMIARVLQGRPQTVGEIAAAALFLVSDAASAVTGQTLNVDGGMVFY